MCGWMDDGQNGLNCYTDRSTQKERKKNLIDDGRADEWMGGKLYSYKDLNYKISLTPSLSHYTSDFPFN